MGWNIGNAAKAYLQKQIVEGFKKSVIAELGRAKAKVQAGYTISPDDVDHLLLAIKLPPLIGELAKPFIVGLNLRDLVGKYDDGAIKAIDQAVVSVGGWRL